MNFHPFYKNKAFSRPEGLEDPEWTVMPEIHKTFDNVFRKDDYIDEFEDEEERKFVAVMLNSQNMTHFLERAFW